MQWRSSSPRSASRNSPPTGQGSASCAATLELHVWVADGRAPGAERHLAGSGSCRLRVTGVDQLHARCAALAVVHPAAPLADKPWGTREFAVLDPDGNLVTLYERR